MNPDNSKEFGRLVDEATSIVHLTHVNPDADGTGSALAMHRWLVGRGRPSRVLLTEAPTRALSFLHEEGELEVGDGSELDESTLVIVYDVSNPARLGCFQEAVTAHRGKAVLFDHHDASGTDDSWLCFVDEGAGATSQVVYELFESLGVEVDERLAVPLYVALIADTGSFNYGKTTPRTHEIAGHLLAAGVDPLAIHGLMEGRHPLEGLRVAGEVLGKMEQDAEDSRIAFAQLSASQVARAGRGGLDSLHLVNYTIAIDGVVAGVLMSEVSEDLTRLSFRSKGDVSVVETARELGGGGHRNAAGASFPGTPDQARGPVLSTLRRHIQSQLGSPEKS
ncbi:MAG: bifunctional oligoribonuclease/PAP phosphatase NrnA [Acidobacteriota bacterium]